MTWLSKELRLMQRVAIDALGVIPRRSKYRTLAYRLIREEIEAEKYPALRSRLVEYVRKNGLENKFSLEA